jgi:tetratricopeptide (TPR) repeat protein
MGMNEPELARAELLRALQLDPTSVPVRAQLASLYAQIGEKELAIEEANVALERMPNNLQLITLLAGTLHGLGRDDEAAEVLDRITMEEHADVPRARLILAELYRKVGKTERARELLTEQQQITPNDVTIPAQLALLDLADRDPLGALKRLDEGIERFPENALLWELRARVRLGFMRQGQLVYPDEAEADLKKSIELGTQRIEAYMLLASLYRRSNRLEDAIKTYEQARDAAPGDATLHLVLGTLYEQLGRRDDAIREYEAVIRIDPEQGVALNNLAWLLATRDPENARTLDRALQLAQQAKEVLPESPSVADTLGYVMLKKKIPSAAISLFREAMDGYEKGDPVRSVVRYHLAQAYEVSGDRGRAIEELQLALAEAAAFPERSAAEAMLKSLQES